MLFNSIDFLLFFPPVVTIYYLIQKKAQYIWLLMCSYYFYMCWNPKYALLLLTSTGITYLGGLGIEWIAQKQYDQRKKIFKMRCCLILGIMSNIAILGYFKYLNFTINILNRVIENLHLGKKLSTLDIILPVGISFYIFQALGYLIDVYRREIYAEKNFLRYALFVSFFPQLVAGPIERSKNLLIQLAKPIDFSYENMRRGLLLMLWGFFLKLVIADRAAIIVNGVYEDSASYPGFYIIVATFLFAIQIYCDFHGYSTIARGAALVLGIHLMDNFQAPYFSKSVKEFWRRWHISLSEWFRDYLYIPLGGSRKGTLRKELNLLIVFAVSGLWHGASLAYIAWGLLNGCYQVIEDICSKAKKLYDNKKEQCATFSINLYNQIKTFILVSFAWLFFRADGLSAAVSTLKNMLVFNWTVLFDETIYTSFGMQRQFFTVLILSIVILFWVDAKKYKGENVIEMFLCQGWMFRTITELCLIFIILLFGCYGEMYDTSAFIYFQF